MLNFRRNFDLTSLAVIGITLFLFIIALFTKGLTHDILLEAAVFLISAKLIIMAYKNADAARVTNKRLDDIYKLIQLESRSGEQTVDRQEP